MLNWLFNKREPQYKLGETVFYGISDLKRAKVLGVKKSNGEYVYALKPDGVDGVWCWREQYIWPCIDE